MSTLLQVILRRIVFRVESVQCIFRITLFRSMLDNVTNWYQKKFGNGDVIVCLVSERHKLRLCGVASLGGWGRYILVSELRFQH
jgi:hypothetical protein